MRVQLAVGSAILLFIAGCSTSVPLSAMPPLPTGPAYSGPAIPGLAQRPDWSQSIGPVVAAVAVDGSFAVVTGRIGSQELVVLDATTGKLLNRIPLPEAGSYINQPTLTSDVLGGRPVAVARFEAHFPASGLSEARDQDADLVVDASGKQVWTSRSGDEQHLVGGYIISGGVQQPFGFVNGNGPQTGTLTNVTTIAGTDGQTVADLSGDPAHQLYAIVGKTALVSEFDGQSGGEQLRGLDLTAQGKTAWTGETDDSQLYGPVEEYLGSFGDTVLTDRESTAQQVIAEVRDAASGKEIGSSTGSSFACHVATYDPDTDTVVCASLAVAPEPLTAITLSSGKIDWQQPETRGLGVGTAAHGITYLSAQSNGQAPDYVAIKDATGQVIAENLVAAPIAITADRVALVSYAGSILGFHLAT